VELAIAGDGQERENLKRLIASKPKPDRFHLLGFQSELSAFYQALDIFALSSLREGLPNVLLEAMAFEVPVASTNAGGVGRLIENEHNGLLVPVNDVPALTEALSRLLFDKTLAEKLAAQGRETIESRFSFAARMERVCAVYEELLAK
jgi:glycosyltransferase involved in cell wall biosynthesis